MEKTYKIVSNEHPSIYIEATPGHFVTSHSHINYYIDITQIKHQLYMAKDAAVVLAEKYNIENIDVDTIVCMDESEILGAFLADELSKPKLLSTNAMKKICIVPPEFNANNQMIFRDNLRNMIKGKNVLLLIASVTTGKTIKRSLECIDYYEGNIVGISAVFSAAKEVASVPINALFTPEDIPAYHTHSYRDCPECKEGIKVDALVNSYGYSLLQG